MEIGRRLTAAARRVQTSIGQLRPADAAAFEQLVDMSCELDVAARTGDGDQGGGASARLDKGEASGRLSARSSLLAPLLCPGSGPELASG